MCDEKRMRPKQIGLSLLEVLLSIGIIAVILLCGVYFFNEIKVDTGVTKSVTLLQKISRASYQWLQVQKQIDFCGATTNAPTSCPSGTAVSTAALINAGLISPYDECGGTPCLLTPWGTPITTEAAVGAGGSGPQYIRVILPKVPDMATCIQLQQNMLHNSPTGVQSDCAKSPNTAEINYFVEL